MLSTLIESKRKADRSAGGTAASVVLHTTIIVLLVAATAQAKDHPKDDIEKPAVIYSPIEKPAPPPKPRTPPPEPKAAPMVRRGLHVLVALPKIPDELPPIDLARPATDPGDFMGAGVEGGSASGVRSGVPSGPSHTYVCLQVEKQTMPVKGNPNPVYPSMLESARVDGEVLAQFVVDTMGRVDMSTFTVPHATNELFVNAVKRVLPMWRFYPANIGGYKVRQLVQMPLAFKVP